MCSTKNEHMETVFLSLTKNDFQALMVESVNSCLRHNAPAQSQPPTEIIDRAELCKRLNITEPTAIRWGKKNVIPCFRIGSSIRYNWPKVIEALESKKKSGGLQK